MARSTTWLAAAGLAAVAGGGLWFVLGGSGGPAGPSVEREGASESEAASGEPALAGRSAPAVVRPAQAIAGHVRGTVKDAAGKPVEGVRVVAWRTGSVRDDADPTTWSTEAPVDRIRKALATVDAPTVGAPKVDVKATSGAGGTFDLPVGETGAYAVRAEPEPPRWGTRADVNLDAAHLERTVTLRVRDGHPFLGRVLGAGDQPVPAVVSGAFSLLDDDASFSAPGVATAPATGDFSWPAVPDGRGTLTVVLPGKVSFAVRVTTPAPDVVIVRVPGGGVVRGRVSDAQGAPVAGADVLVSTYVSGRDDYRTSQGRAKSGPDGLYRIAGLSPGKIQTLMVSAEGFVPRSEVQGSGRWIGTELKDGQELVVDLVVNHGGTVAGRVAEPGGAPVADAEVLLLLPQNRWGERQPSARVDAAGRFRLEDVPLGRYVIVARSPTHYLTGLAAEPTGISWGPDGPILPTAAPLVVLSKDGEAVSRDVEMRPGLSIRGRVTGPGGAPVGGARVQSNSYGLSQTAWAWGASWQGGNEALATTEADGTFRATGLPPRDRWILLASKPPLSGTGCAPFRLAAGEPEPEVALSMEAGATVAGRVVDADGGPLSGRQLQWYSQDRNRQGWGQATSDADGAFRFEGVVPASVIVNVWGRSGQGTQQTVEGLKPGEVREGVEIRLAKPAKISGVVVDAEGKPCGGRALVAQAAEGGGRISGTQSLEDGTFEFSDVSEGSWRVGLNAMEGEAGYMGLSGEGQTVKAPAENVRIVAPPRTTTVVAGRVLLPDGTPVPLCIVRTGRGANPMSFRQPGSDEVVGGEFRREVAQAPPFDVLVSGARGPTGEALNVRTKTVKVTEATNDLVITLETGGEIRGRVLDASNGGVEGVTLRAGTATAVSDATGAFRLSGLGTEDVSISAQPPPRYSPPAPVKASPGATDVVVRVNAGKSISGRVVGLEEASGVQVSVQATWSGGNRFVQAAGDGSFVLEGIPDDAVVDVAASVWSSTGERSYRQVRSKGVRAGTEGLVLRMETGVAVSGVVLDADGRPATNLQAIARDVDEGAYGAEVKADGTFEFKGLAPGPVQITVSRRTDGRSLTAPVRVDAPAKDVRITLPPMVRLFGRVLGADAKGFRISATSTTAKPNEASGASAVSGADGSFSMDVPGDGTYRLAAQKPGDDRFALVDGARPGTEVGVRLETGASIDGTLEDAAGKPPAENAWVMVSSDRWNANAQVGADGTFRVRGLPSGRYRVSYMTTSAHESLPDEVEAGTTGLRLKIGGGR